MGSADKNIAAAFDNIKFVLAPMVDQSELAWRMLARKYGAQLCYTPMYNANVIIQNSAYREKVLDDISCPKDRPLIVQFCANTTEQLLSATKIVQPYCDAVDLNLGCPQHIARRGHYGAFLQDDWDLLHKMISVCCANSSVPITAKIRVFPQVKKTVEYARMLESAGCSLLTVHGRTKERKGRDAGLASWTHIAAVKKSLKIPVLSNGNIRSLIDIESCLSETGANGVMVAESHLSNPCIFEGENPPVYDIAKEYLAMVKLYPCPISYVRTHLFRLWMHALKVYPEYREKLGTAHSLQEMETINDKIHEQCQKEDKMIKQRESTSTFPHWICQPHIRKKEGKPPEDCNEKKDSEKETVSRNQQRRLLKYQRKMAGLKFKRKAERIRKKEKMAERKQCVDKVENNHSTSNMAKLKINCRLMQAREKDSDSIKVCVDLSWAHAMNTKEISKLAGQLGRMYGSNRKSSNPAGLYFTGFSTDSKLYKECLRKHNGFQDYKICMTDQSYLELFTEDPIIYLSPDAEIELEDVCSSKILILGGLVDETVRLQLTHDAAFQHGLVTRRLPIESFMHRSGHHRNYSSVLAINQVFDILLAYSCTQDWKIALPMGMPPRKGYIVKNDDS